MSFRNLDSPPSFAKATEGGPSEASAWLGRVRDVVNNIMRGKLNCTGAVTLAAGAASTLMSDARIGGGSVLLLQPTTANAAAELGNGTLYFDAPGAGSVVIRHANNAQIDRSFNYVVIG
jgi:hypothetical protein